MRTRVIKRVNMRLWVLALVLVIKSGVFADVLNMVKNGDFSNAATNWKLNTWGEDTKAQGSVVKGEYRIAISAIDTLIYDIQLVQAGLNLKKGKDYLITFEAYASTRRMLQVYVEMAQSPFTSYLANLQQFNLTATKQKFAFVFTMNADSDTNGRIGFNVGNNIDTVYLDNITFSLFEPTGFKGTLLSSKEPEKVNMYICREIAEIKFRSSINGNADLKIYDLNGHLVKKTIRSISAGELFKYRFNLSGIANGYYVLSVASGGAIFDRVKFVLNKGAGRVVP